jgi:hypothetical protein
VGTINSYRGEHKYHSTTIPDSWFKVDVREALMLEVALMFPNEAADQEKVRTWLDLMQSGTRNT